MNNQKVIDVKAIIFDRDGVIIDTDSLVLESVFFGLSKIGVKFSNNDVPLMAGRSIDSLKEFLLNKWSFNFDEFRLIQRQYFYDHLDDAPYFPDMIEFIKNCTVKIKFWHLQHPQG